MYKYLVFTVCSYFIIKFLYLTESMLITLVHELEHWRRAKNYSKGRYVEKAIIRVNYMFHFVLKMEHVVLIFGKVKEGYGVTELLSNYQIYKDDEIKNIADVQIPRVKNIRYYIMMILYDVYVFISYKMGLYSCFFYIVPLLEMSFILYRSCKKNKRFMRLEDNREKLDEKYMTDSWVISHPAEFKRRKAKENHSEEFRKYFCGKSAEI